MPTTLYWYSDPEHYYSQYRSASEPDDTTDRDVFATLERIESRIAGSECKTAAVPFDFEGQVVNSDRRSEFARPIPEVMDRPITD